MQKQNCGKGIKTTMPGRVNAKQQPLKPATIYSVKRKISHVQGIRREG
jgi:hypothetical protein